ncbi:MAG: radical SAM protein [Chloroflexi bacterium]|nr:radical SAM protein [Chloroflexota bacterium]
MNKIIEEPNVNLDSSVCEEIDFGTSGTLNTRLWNLAEQKCIPLGATLEITLHCNLRCVHCYNFDRTVPYPKTKHSKELTPIEIFDIIDQLSDAGCLYLSFSGGESLVHPHLDDFIRHARKRRMAVKVKSNGTLLSVARVKKLVDAGALSIDISLYGATPETHDAFTEQAGSFKKTIEGIRNSRDAGLDTKVNICLVETNVDEVENMIQLVEELGLRYGITPFITARYDGTTSSLDQSINQEALTKLYKGPLHHLMRKPDFNENRSVQCACARATCGISANGDVYPCIGAPIKAGNIREGSFAEIWRNSPELNKIRGLELDDFKSCKPCPDRPYCSRNSGVVFTNSGDYTGPEPFTCMEAATVRMIYLEKHPMQNGSEARAAGSR